MTHKTGVIGYPLKHSLSPVFQQAALDYYKLDVSYELWETEAGQLPLVVENMRSDNYMGANVTIPYKESIIPMIDSLDTQSSMIGAVNTIVNKDGKLHGYNTDTQGLGYFCIFCVAVFNSLLEFIQLIVFLKVYSDSDYTPRRHFRTD